MTTATTSRCYALVPCAGIGTRAGADGPKQYAAVAGRAMVAHTLDALAAVPQLAATLVVLAPDDERFETAAPRFAGTRGWIARRGGATRAATVTGGLAELAARGAEADDWVLVHDAARCLLRPQWVGALIDACVDDPVGGLLALPLADTLKQARDGRSVATLTRDDKWAAQTPQMFRLGLLQRALHAAGDAVTDEASAIEFIGLQPRLVVGHADNLKLTWPDDFARAERIFAERQLAHQRRSP
jgi:2-C-methyl-D-erythritol 4-phosphate cytidylyltransferase